MTISRLTSPSYQGDLAWSAGESAYPQLWKDLIGAWVPAMGPTGNTLFDLGPYKNHGTLTNMDSTNWVIGDNSRLPGYALDFAGEPFDDHVLIGDHDIHDLTSGLLTIIAWIKLDDFGEGTQGRILDKGGANTSNSWAFIVNDDAGQNELQYWTNNVTGGGSNNGVIDTTAWYHVAVVQNGGDVTFYVNGKAAGTLSSIQTPGAGTQALAIAIRASDEDRAFDGQISYVLLWNRALDASEIRFDYSVPFAPFIKRRRRSYLKPIPSGATRRIHVPRRVSPSYHADFTRSAGESVHLGLWQGLQYAWVPNLGPTGVALHDITRKRPGTITGVTPDVAWTTAVSSAKVPGFSILLGGASPASGDNIELDNSDTNLTPHLTIAIWIYPIAFDASAQDNRAISKSLDGTAASAHRWMVGGINSGTNSPNWRLRLKAGEGLTDTKVWDGSGINDLPVTGEWNFVAMTYDGTNMTAYAASEISFPSLHQDTAVHAVGGDVDTSTSARVIIGAQPNTSPTVTQEWDGYIGPIYLYNRALTVSQIQLILDDPFAPVRLRPRLVVVRASAKADVTLTPPVGSQILTGNPGLMDFGVIVPTEV